MTPYTPVARPQATEQQCFGDIPLAPIPSERASLTLPPLFREHGASGPHGHSTHDQLEHKHQTG